MRFIEVNEIPKKVRSCNHKLEDDILEFMAMNIPMARVEFDEFEYSCVESLRICLKFVCRRVGLPIQVKMYNGEVFLIRTDM